MVEAETTIVVNPQTVATHEVEPVLAAVRAVLLERAASKAGAPHG